MKSLFFSHFKAHFVLDNGDEFYEYFSKSIEELSRNDWELHKKYVKEGHNPNEIAKIIRNDEIEKLQEISSQPNFNLNQTIQPSLYERCSFINQRNVKLIDYAAFFSSVKCFKHLLMNGAKLDNTGKYAVAGGNEEIIYLCEQNHSTFEGAYKTAIKFHQYKIFKYIYENEIIGIDNLEELGTKCVLHDNYELLSFLLEEGMEINENIFIASIKTGNLYIVKDFLKNNCIRIDFVEISGFSGNVELSNYLIKNGYIDLSKIDNKSALTNASKNGYTEIVELLLKQKDIIDAKNKDEWTTLIEASRGGHIEIVKLLLEQKGIDINAKDNWNGKTALIWASEKGYIEIVKLLLEQKGIDINAKDRWNGKTALMLASRGDHTEIVKLILEKNGIDINAKDNRGYTALMLASKEGHTEIVKLLLEKERIDVNAKDKDENTSLILASAKDHAKIVELLLEQEGIDINAQNKNGKTALMNASWFGNTKVVKLLLEQKGIDVNAKDKDGNTAFFYASENGHTEIVKSLLEQKGIDVNAKDRRGRTALIFASAEGHTEIIKLLLEQKGIDVNTKDNIGRAAIIWACIKGHKEIFQLLLEQKAELSISLPDLIMLRLLHIV